MGGIKGLSVTQGESGGMQMLEGALQGGLIGFKRNQVVLLLGVNLLDSFFWACNASSVNTMGCPAKAAIN